jgi:methylmalonyl-CoA/ethylmalonyl-CoA epimerase
VTAGPVLVELALPPLLHVGIVVLDLEAAAANFERRWGTHVTDIVEVTLRDVLYHNRPATISLRRGLIHSGASQIELTQPLSDSPFRDFLKERRSDGVHHLAYVVADIDVYLGRLNPIGAELVLDTRPSGDGSRAVYIDGFAHGPAIELIERTTGGAAND